MERNKDAEKDIINAAREVFHNKGFKGATMRDIASRANINLAMVNYYFRSKEKLFDIIIDETLETFYVKLAKSTGRNDIDIIKKIEIIINEYTDFFWGEPNLPLFLVGELIRNPDKLTARFKKIVNKSNVFKNFQKQLSDKTKDGTIKQVGAFPILLNILSLVTFPLIAMPLIKEIHGSEITINETMVALRKREIVELIINSIKT